MLWKIVVRSKNTAQVVQIHEAYKSNVGKALQELLDKVDSELYTYTITRLDQ